MALPERPRLIDDARARRHVVDGREKVIVFVPERDELFEFEPRQWCILEVADGTRDAEGIALAAGRLGAGATVRQVLGFLGGVADRGLLTDGPPEHHPEAVATGDRETPPDRRIVPLPGFSLHCDGTGGCCRFFGTVLFAPADRARARGLLPDRSVGPVAPERLFTPLRGSAPTPVSVPVINNGACGFLDNDGACSIHRVGGLAAKPVGCASFPVRFIDDGEVVRATAVPECGCVVSSGGRSGGSALAPELEVVADLPSTTVVIRLPDEVVVSPGCSVARAEAVAWSDRRRDWGTDPAAALWSHAADLDREGLAAALRLDAAAPAARDIAPWFDAVAVEASRRARGAAQWRSAQDTIRRSLELVAATCALLRDRAVLQELLDAAAPPGNHEATYLAAVGWGHGWLLGHTVADNLRDRAVRIWLARAIVDLQPEPPPLAIVDALMRAQGLSGYVSKSGSTGSSGNSTPGNA